MISTKHIIRYGCIICLVTLFWCTPDIIAQDSNSIHAATNYFDCSFVRISTDQEKYHIKQEINITITINLCTNGTYSFHTSGNTYDIVVKDNNGDRLPLSSRGDAIFNQMIQDGSGEVGIRPGTVLQREVLLNTFYDINKTGDYTIQIRVSNLYRYGPAPQYNLNELKIESNIIHIKVE